MRFYRAQRAFVKNFDGAEAGRAALVADAAPSQGTERMDESEGKDRKPMLSHAYRAAATRKDRRRSGQVGDDVQAHIGDRLKALYDDVLSEPVPDRFLDLLSQLERRERGEPGRETQ